MAELRVPLLGKHNIVRPKSIWGRTSYLEEQANMMDFIRGISRMAGSVNPIKYALSGGIPKKLLKVVISPDERVKQYREAHARAVQSLEKMGV